MIFKDFALAVFSVFSRLYPKDYQRRYSEDMKSVFRDILEDSDDFGRGHAIQSLIKESLYLPGCLAREYLSILEGGSMKTTRQILTVTLFGFFTIFFLFGIERCIITWFFLIHIWIDQPRIFIMELIIDGIISGIFAGGAIGFALSIKNKAPMMAVCGLGFIIGRLLTGPTYWEILGIPTKWVNSEVQVLLMLAASPITGLLIGAFSGLLWRGWKSGILFGLASSLIFSVGLFGQYSFMLLFDRWMLPTSDAQFLSRTLRLFIGTIISYSILGGIVGILWGVLLDRLPRLKSIGFSGLVI